MTALLQGIDAITKQHKATMKSPNFNDFYINSIARGPMTKANVNAIDAKDSLHSEGDQVHDQGLNCLGSFQGCHVANGLDD